MTLSDEDKALFRDMMNSVKPLHKTVNREPKAAPIVKLTRRKPEPMPPQRTDYYLSNHYTDIVHSNSSLSYCNASMPRKRLRELKNGLIPWEARIDLHGLRPDAAREALCEFIDKKSRSANRCLLIIHGKGSRNGEAPVLKNHVNHWLQQLPHVLAFHSALPRDGGAGALYVLLKRQRE